MQLIMKKLHEQRLNWKPHGKFSSLGIFCFNDALLVDFKVPYIGHVVLE